MQNELKSCPFCGGKVFYLRTDHKNLYNRTHQYNCSKCNATIFLDAEGHYKTATETHIEAVETFNRRFVE